MIQRARFATFAAVTAGLVVGCADKKKASPSADAGGMDSGSPDAAGPDAMNEGNVHRYDDESLVDRLPLVVKASSALVTSSCPKGDAIATLQRGASANQLSERNGFYRVTFADDKEPTRRKMGWIARFAFDDPVAPPRAIALPRCPTTMGLQVTVLAEEGKARCAYECAADRECPGSACEAAAIVPDNGVLPPVPTYTTVCSPPSPDGGADAGARRRSYFGIPHASNGKCPKLFIDAPKVGDLCYRFCKSDTDCPEPATCGGVPAASGAGQVKLCSTN